MELYPTYAVYFGSVVVSFVLGYLVGRVDLIWVKLATSARHDAPYTPPQTNTLRAAMQDAKAAAERPSKISIDNNTFVTPINTAGMEKTQPISLGKTIEKQDDIQAAVSKLAQLKGR
jgi:hypothetical protein